MELTSVTDVKRLKSDWKMLEADAECSYFQSWGWIGAWLKKVVHDLEPEVMRVWDRDELVAIGIFVKSSVRRSGGLTSRKLFLNEAPVANRNMVTEYNGLLVKKGQEEAVYKAVIYHLRFASMDWDELYLGMIKKSITDTFVDQLGTEFYLTIENQVKTCQFDSRGIEQGMDGICSTFSENRRNQVKKYFSAYHEDGEIFVTEAEDVDQALDYFSELKELHATRRITKGKAGSFENELWEDFHRELISSRYVEHEIQLIKVYTQNSVIGYIYSFLWRGRVYVMQSGLNMEMPKGVQPGYVSHIKAILHNQQQGYKLYDLLSEGSGYKNILCNSTEELVTISVKRIAFNSMIRQLSPSCVRNGYISKVIKATISDKFNTYSSESLDFILERWVRLINKWPSHKKKILLVGAESSGTTAVSDLLFKESNNLRYLEEGDQQWVWDVYQNVYQKKSAIKDYPRLQIFDAIKVPGFSVIIKEFLEEFPNTTVVCLVRDPRDFASSAIKTWKIRRMSDFANVPWTDVGWLQLDCDDPVECLAKRWKTYINAASQIKEVIFVKYEDFCTDKVKVIAGLCEKLELPFDANRVKQRCDVQLSHASVRAYRPTGPGGWRTSILEEKHIKIIEKTCKDEMETWGYEPATSADFKD